MKKSSGERDSDVSLESKQGVVDREDAVPHGEDDNSDDDDNEIESDMSKISFNVKRNLATTNGKAATESDEKARDPGKKIAVPNSSLPEVCHQLENSVMASTFISSQSFYSSLTFR